MAIQINTKPVVAPPAPVVKAVQADAPATYATRADRIDSHTTTYFADALDAQCVAAHAALAVTPYKSDQYRPIIAVLVAHLDAHKDFAGVISAADARRQMVCTRHWIKLLGDCAASGRNRHCATDAKDLAQAKQAARKSALRYRDLATRVQDALAAVAAGSIK